MLASPMNTPTTRELKSRAQKLKPVVHIGHDGISPNLLSALDQALADHGLVKVRFADHKALRKQLSAELSALTGARLVLQVGHTTTLYRPPV